MNLNESALARCEALLESPEQHDISSSINDAGARIVDCGVESRGSVNAGQSLAEICLAGLGSVGIESADPGVSSGLAVAIRTQHPVAACMASQYAGWQIATDDYFAMGSGPMRAAAGKEALFADIGHRETADHCVGILESGKLPTIAACEMIAQACGIRTQQLTLLVAPTSSIAGTVQVVARSVETALHKMHELRFDLSRVVRGVGSAPLPPVAKNDLAAIGITNDAILYGGRVTLEVTGDDDSLADLAPQIPSCASRDHGRPFAEIFRRYDHDFYKIDPLLFSPAVVQLVNLDTGSKFQAGQIEAEVLRQSFAHP